jgi:ubiquinone/menaquinone biosynthesis C-methylase UbiE
MGFYSDRILPHLIRMTMRDDRFSPYRQRAVSPARGRVLEVGIGSGENLSRYGSAVQEVVGLEPNVRLAGMARQLATRLARQTTILEASAEAMPLDAGGFDTVVMTWTLCSVYDPRQALREIRRVLKPQGQFLFAEHGLAPDRRVQWWQHRLTPLWTHLAGGCHLNRDMRALILDAGFQLERLATGYMEGPRPLTFIYEGAARR